MNNAFVDNFFNEIHSKFESIGDNLVFIDARSSQTVNGFQLRSLLHRCSCFIRENGLRPGDNVVSLLPNSIEKILLFLTCATEGFGFVPLDPCASSREINHVFNKLTPKLIVDLINVNSVIPDEHKSKCHSISFSSEHFDWLPPAGEETRQDPKQSGKLFISTSGSTGEPKFIKIDCLNLWKSAQAFTMFHDGVLEGALFYNNMPMAYLGGLFNLCLIPLSNSSPVVIAEPDAAGNVLRFWQDVIRYKVQAIWLTPTMLRALLKIFKKRWTVQDTKRLSVTIGFLGTAPISLEEKKEFESVFGIRLLENYGLTETTFITSETLESRALREDGSVGEILPWVEVMLNSEDSESRSSKNIMIKSNYLMDGYFHGNGVLDEVDKNNWFDTGDLGHLVGKTLVLSGRSRDIIKKGGVFVNLAEIELIARQMPGVSDVACLKIEHEFYGEDYVLFVTVNSDGLSKSVNIRTDVRKYLNDALVQNKWPSEIYVVREIPKTKSGKTSKPGLNLLFDTVKG